MPDVFTPLVADAHVARRTARRRPETPRGGGDAREPVGRARRRSRWRACAQASRAEAFARGHAAGMADAHEQAHAQVARVLAVAARAPRASVHAHEQRWLGNVEENLAAIAVTIARHLIHRELAGDASVLTDLEHAARCSSSRSSAASRCACIRTTCTSCRSCSPLGQAWTAPAIARVRWLADPHIMRGGCLVEGRERVLDGRVDTALERAYRTLGQVQA